MLNFAAVSTNDSEHSDDVSNPQAQDEFDELLRSLKQDDFSDACCRRKDTLQQLLSEDPSIETNSRFDLHCLLSGEAPEAQGPRQTVRSTPPLDVLEQIEEEDEDKILMDAQSSLFAWSFRHGTYVGAQHEEGDYDLDSYGEQVYSPIQGFFDKFPTYKLWWLNNILAKEDEITERFHYEADRLASAA
ncbi:hypothetical protein BV898_05214 [Hypsibius exemplaris]|uniref:Uncharacterized protein n=1 Tax=Hypsibius exemplaris TaxID=2072580 RepID=A0A1W0X0Q2_HYPEX|nr:hypothetical protein BV898_05214 [Hypsibius exemplaris]